MDNAWLVNGKLIAPNGIRSAAVRIAGGRIAMIRRRPPAGARRVNVRGAYLAPGFIDLHVWGEPEVVSRAFARHGTTAFLSAIGPEPLSQTVDRLAALRRRRGWPGSICLGAHLEGPFLNPKRGGALPKRWMRRPTAARLRALARTGGVRLMTLAPELPGGLETIRWCRRHGVTVSLGHSDATAAFATRAAAAGALAVTHVFNGMRPFHHREPGLVGVALADERLTAMIIADGVHVSPAALRLAIRTKGATRVCLVTDSIRYHGWAVTRRSGAYYLKRGTLAGSDLTMMDAVRNAIRLGGASLSEAVGMASDVPARLLGERLRGTLAVGKRADLVAFDRRFRVRLTMVGGRVVYEG